MINTNATEPSAKADFTVGGISGTLADSYDSAKWAVAESQGVVFSRQQVPVLTLKYGKQAPMAITGPQRLGITIMHRWYCSIVNIRSSTLWKRYAGKAAPSGL